MSEAQQRRTWRGQAAAIKKIEPCIYQFGRNSNGSNSALSVHKLQQQQQQQPLWDFQPVQLPASSRVRLRTSTEGRTGQAVLSLPFAKTDVALQLPPALQLAATPTGNLDCRMQLLGITAEWPTQRQSRAGDQDSTQAKLLPAKSAAVGFAYRSGALLLAHVLFPDHTHNLLGWLAVPVAVADGIAVVHSALPESARHAAANRASKLRDRLQGRPDKRLTGSSLAYQQCEQGVGWLDAAGGVLLGAVHAVRCLSGPAAALASAGWLWSLLYPSSHSLCSCMVALLAVAADYSQLSNDISRGRLGAGREVEAAWHARHKQAAQRLALYCRDLPATPPLQPLVYAASCCSIAAGLAVDGQCLSGFAAASHHSMHSTATSSRAASGVQLLLSASIHEPTDGSSSAKSKQHEAAGLSRKQLLELFTGSTDDPLTPCAGASCDQAMPVAQSAAPAATVVYETDQLNRSSNSSSGQAGNGRGVSRRRSTDSIAGSSSGGGRNSTEHSADLTVQLHSDDDRENFEATSSNHTSGCSTASATAVAACCSQAGAWQQQELVCFQGALTGHSTAAAVRCSSSSAGVVCADDPLAFLNDLPLYGQEDHAGGSGLLLAGTHWGMWQLVELGLRAVYLLIVFAPFLLLGLPMLLMSWWLLSRAAAAQQQQRLSASGGSNTSRRALQAAGPPHGMAVVSPLPQLEDNRSRSVLLLFGNLPRAAAEAAKRPAASLWRLLQHFLSVLTYLAALLDLLLVLLLGGHWAAGVSAWESAGLFLRRRAWQLLLFSSSAAGAAFIKWGQWSASRRDIFPEDFCDTLAALHDRAPVHSFKHSRRQIEAAFGKKLDELFIRFDPKPLASGSIAQVHRATLRTSCSTPAAAAAAAGAVLTENSQPAPSSNTAQQQQQQQSDADAAQEVVVKVCHPNVKRHICMDFRLLSGLSAAAARVPALRGLSIRESVAQFSHTMTAQTDLRVEAVHALRFHNNFSGVCSSVQIPRPIPGLVSEQVLVESYEAGRSVAVFMKEPTPINPQIVALGVDAFLKMLLVDNFVHTDLHPGNILFRAVPTKQQQRRSTASKQQGGQLAGSSCSSRKRWWQFWLRGAPSSSSGSSGADASSAAARAAEPPAQWELELQGMINKQQNLWTSRHAADAGAAAESTTTATCWYAQAAAGTAPDNEAARQFGQPLQGSSSGSSTAGQESALAAQLVLLDFGLAEQLNAEVRHHFISFLNAISAGDGLCAARHLLRWSHHQTCTDTVAFKADVVDLFNSSCKIHSEAGINLDAVMKAVLGLARKHGVSIDSCYASLVISVCVLVGFATSLDPGVNIMDAATPGLLAYSLTGKVLGRLYS